MLFHWRIIGDSHKETIFAISGGLFDWTINLLNAHDTALLVSHMGVDTRRVVFLFTIISAPVVVGFEIAVTALS